MCGVPQDDAEAVRWYRLAAEQGDVEAQARLRAIENVRNDVPEAVSLPRNGPEVLPLPRNGAVTRQHSGEAVASLTIRTRGDDRHYFIKLVESRTDRSVLTVFVRGGQRITVDVPLGRMEMRYTVGSTWYGDELLFGPDTVYNKVDRVLEFAQTTTTVARMTVELIPQQGGNLETSRISAAEW